MYRYLRIHWIILPLCLHGYLSAVVWRNCSSRENGANLFSFTRPCDVCWLLNNKQHLHFVVEHHLWGWGTVHLLCQEPKGEESQPQRYLDPQSRWPKYAIDYWSQLYIFTRQLINHYRLCFSRTSLSCFPKSQHLSICLVFQWERWTILWPSLSSRCWVESLA